MIAPHQDAATESRAVGRAVEPAHRVLVAGACVFQKAQRLFEVARRLMDALAVRLAANR